MKVDGIQCSYCGRTFDRSEFPDRQYSRCMYCQIEAMENGCAVTFLTAGIIAGLLIIIAGLFL